MNYEGGDSDSTPVSTPGVHVERVVTLVIANDDNYALAA